MHRLLAIAALAMVAGCGHPSESTTPTTPTTPPTPPPASVESSRLTAAALVEFVQAQFPAAVAAGTVQLDFGSDDIADQLLGELALMGITTGAQLVAIVPPDFATRGIAATATSSDPSTNVSGLIRDLLMIHDVRGYFTTAWREAWTATSRDDFPALTAYGVDLGVLDAFGVFADSDYGDDDGDDDGGDDPCAD